MMNPTSEIDLVKIGIVQMKTCSDKSQNVQTATEKVAECAKKGAEIVILPEIFNSPYASSHFREYSEPRGGPTWQALSKMASDNSVFLIGGSIPEFDNNKIYNTSFVFDRTGKEIAYHRKMHLFDIDIEGGQRFKESDSLTAGDKVTTFEIDLTKNDKNDQSSNQKIIILGLCICFDFRFPELSRLMVERGATILVVPAAFNMTTGPLHWELMFRQRAVDNQCFTIGVAPARDVNGLYVSYGNSIVVSPWGEVIYRADEKESIAIVDINLNQINEVRKQLPLLSSRRTDIYQMCEITSISNSLNSKKSEVKNEVICDMKNGLNLYFELAVEDEILEILNLLIKVQNDLHERNILQWTDEIPIYEIRHYVLEKSCYVMKKGKNGKIIGICCLTNNNSFTEYFNKALQNEDILYLTKVAVLPEFQRNGIGAEIVKCAINEARNRFNKNIALDCWSGNEKLKKFYSNLGFSFVADVPEEDYTVSIFRYNIH